TAEIGSTTALAQAQAEFTVGASTSASLNSDSTTFGDGVSYQGIADSISQVFGNFFVEANQLFTLDFIASLNLETSSDTLQSESASAISDLSLFLIDSNTQSIYESFSLFSYLNSQGDNDYFDYQASQNITFALDSSGTSFGGTEEVINASVEGSLGHLFTSSTNLTLLAVTRNQASVSSVKTPESSNPLGLLSFFSLIGISFGVKNTKRQAVKLR
ncbi:MAG: hypothetical protein F6K28_48130, partial [Microcoleus sp. SIO2G3]|nr:hypothetical protein [Microcoleus sp. SIO2G3]